MTNTVDDATTTEKASDVAKKIWLAGLGAYGKAFDGASEQFDKFSEQYEKVSKDTTVFFDDLVAKGTKLDVDSQSKLSEAKSKTSSSIEERISKVRNSLHLNIGGDSSVSDLNDKIDALTAKVDALLDGAKPAKKTVSKSRSASSAA